MAGATELKMLDQSAFSAVALVDEMAEKALKSALAEKFGSSFVTLVDPTCHVCNDFSKFFNHHAQKKNISELFRHEILTETPNLTEVVSKLKNVKPGFFLLPGYSKQSGFVISELAKKFPDSRFVGSDGWGDGEFGYLTKYLLGKRQSGLSIRAGMPANLMFEKLKLQKFELVWKQEIVKLPFISFALIEIVRKTSSMLCSLKPKSKSAFFKAVASQKKDYFHLRSGLSIYKLKNGELMYEKKAD